MKDFVLCRMMSVLMASIFIGLCSYSPALCGQKPEKAKNAVICQAGNWKLTFGDLERIVSYYPPKQRAIILQDPKKLMTLARRLTQAKVLSDMAYAEGLQNRPDIREQLKLNQQDRLALVYVQEKVVNGLKVSDEDVRLYYRSHKDDYKVPAQIKVRHILLRMPKNADKKVVQQTRKRALNILKKARSGKDFSLLAEAFSEDPGSRARGGELGWVVRSQLDRSFAKAAFAAKKGQIVGPVRSAYGFHILEVEDRRPARQLPYKTVAGRIRKKLMSQLRDNKVHDFIEAAMKKAGATINNERILDLAVQGQ